MIQPAVFDHLQDALSSLASANFSLVTDEIDLYADELLEAEADEEYHILLDLASEMEGKAREYGYDSSEYYRRVEQEEDLVVHPNSPEALRTREGFIAALWAAEEAIESVSGELEAVGSAHRATEDESFRLWQLIGSVDAYLDGLDVLCPDVNITPHRWMKE